MLRYDNGNVTEDAKLDNRMSYYLPRQVEVVLRGSNVSSLLSIWKLLSGGVSAWQKKAAGAAWALFSFRYSDHEKSSESLDSFRSSGGIYRKPTEVFICVCFYFDVLGSRASENFTLLLVIELEIKMEINKLYTLMSLMYVRASYFLQQKLRREHYSINCICVCMHAFLDRCVYLMCMNVNVHVS